MTTAAAIVMQPGVRPDPLKMSEINIRTNQPADNTATATSAMWTIGPLVFRVTSLAASNCSFERIDSLDLSFSTQNPEVRVVIDHHHIASLRAVDFSHHAENPGGYKANSVADSESWLPWRLHFTHDTGRSLTFA